MRHISFTVSDSHVFYVDGLSSFPGEIANKIASLLWGGAKPSESAFRRTYLDVYAVVYYGSVDAGHSFTSGEMMMLIGFREWLQRVETRESSSISSIHILGNLNEGTFLAFAAEGY